MVNLFKQADNIADANKVARNWDEVLTSTIKLSDSQIDDVMPQVNKRLNLNLTPAEMAKIDPQLKKQLVALDEMNRRMGLNIDINKEIPLDTAKKAEPVATSEKSADAAAAIIAKDAGKKQGKEAQDNAIALWRKYKAQSAVVQAGIAGVTVILVLGVFGVRPKDLIKMGGEEMGDILATLTAEMMKMGAKAAEPVTNTIGSFFSSFWYVFLIIAVIFILGAALYLTRSPGGRR